jgi:hypothetical protein
MDASWVFLFEFGREIEDFLLTFYLMMMSDGVTSTFNNMIPVNMLLNIANLISNYFSLWLFVDFKNTQLMIPGRATSQCGVSFDRVGGLLENEVEVARGGEFIISFVLCFWERESRVSASFRIQKRGKKADKGDNR